jgi:hypothetical protein
MQRPIDRSARHARLTTFCNKLFQVMRDCQNAHAREERAQRLALGNKERQRGIG